MPVTEVDVPLVSSSPSLLQVQRCGVEQFTLLFTTRTSAMDHSDSSRKHFCRDQLTKAHCDCLFVS